MSRRWIRRASGLSSRAVMVSLGIAAALPAGAQAPVPVGGELQVNSYTTSFQSRPSVATDANGGFVVVWLSYGSSGTDTSGPSIQGQRHASDGSTQGAQFQINSYTTSSQRGPFVAAEANGDFVVVWASDGSSGTDTTASIQGQRYASDGSALGAQFQVNSYTSGFQYDPSVAADADGDFVVVWYSMGSPGTDTSFGSIQGQRYASTGSAQGAQFQVNNYTTQDQGLSSVAADPDGDFVVVWTSKGSPGTDWFGYSIQGQRYASDGSAQGAQFQVNTFTMTWQFRASVAADPGGGFLVAWDCTCATGSDTDTFSIQSRRYAANGAALGPQFQVNTYATSEQRYPSVATDADGGFVVVWQSQGSSGTDTGFTYSIQGQRYASTGSAQGLQFQVNTYTTNTQDRPSVAADPDGDFVVVWGSNGSSGTDTSQSSIQGQRFRPWALAVPAMSSAARAALAGLLLLLGTGYALRRRASLPRVERAAQP